MSKQTRIYPLTIILTKFQHKKTIPYPYIYFFLFGGFEIKLSGIMLVIATTKLSKQVNETLLAKTS
jgi:hypothetical protein